jgi:cation/acetate symporter
MYWRRYTTRGAVTSILVGAVSALVLIYISPTIQVDVLGHDSAPFGLTNPALISMPLAFASGILVSLLWPEREARDRFVDAERQMHLGELARVSRPRPAGAIPVRAK